MRTLTPSRRARATRFGVATLLMLALPAASRAGEAYYLVLLASQRIPNNPDYAHTFATFVRTAWPGEKPCGGSMTLEAHTISWLPQTGNVRTYALLPECGRNFGLYETIQLALANKERVSLWGPYQIEPELYQRAMRRITELESGHVRYKANDMGHHSDHVSNCIHAVSAIADRFKLRVGSPGWGEVATYAVLMRLRPWLVEPSRTHDWVAPALGLEVYPIIYRQWAPPVSGTFLGPVFRHFGGERDLEATYGPPVCRTERSRR